MSLILGPGADSTPTATTTGAGADAARPDVLPALAMVPVLSAGTFTFQPGYGTTARYQGINFANALTHSDLALKLDSAPGGTEAEFAVTYPTITPTTEGYVATATVAHTGVNVAVRTELRRLEQGVWKKTVTLTADAATTAMIRQAHSAPDATVPQSFTTFLGRNAPGTGPTSWSPIPVAAHLWDRNGSVNTVATVLIAGDGVRNEWFRVGPTGTSHQLLLSAGNAGSGRHIFGVTYGQGNTGTKKIAMAAGVPKTFTWTYAALPYNAINLSEFWRGAHRAHALTEGVGGDLFTKVCQSTALGCLSQGTTSDSGAWLIPASSYGGTTYMRDGFWTVVGLDRPEVSAALLARFANAITAENRVPTLFRVSTGGVVTTPFIATDESNMLFLIWAWWHAQRYGTVVPTAAQLDSALLGITANLDANNRYIESNVASAGIGWFDSLTQAAVTTPSSAYNQGLTYVAMRCAQLLGRTVNTTTLAAVKIRYQEFHDGTQMRFVYDRTNLTYPLDVLAMPDLAPEFWANYVLGEKVLTGAQVAAQLDALFATNVIDLNGGRVFRHITYTDGSYLPSSLWKTYIPSDLTDTGGGSGSTQPPGGIYQNGGSWLLFDFIACAVGRFHGYTTNDLDAMWDDRVRAEFGRFTTLHEYLATQEADPKFANTLGTCPVNSTAYGWNALIGPVEAHFGLKRRPLTP